jgi:dolichol-phosphate mannosyltransferase
LKAVVIPAYMASASILGVLCRIGPEIDMIFVVDDCCPQRTGETVRDGCNDPRVRVIRHDRNTGVGGAFLTGMTAAIMQGAIIIVKLDADGQMDPALISGLIWPIEDGRADFVKGNRFYFLSDAASMPKVRLFGNLALSFMTKISTGYWNVMDPTNGFFAIHANIANILPSARIARQFFFESDLLFELGLVRAKVFDFPMRAVYCGEISNLRISRVFGPFLIGHVRNTLRRFLYRYYIRDFSLASIELAAGLALFLFGLIFGSYHWFLSHYTNTFASTGTVMLAVVPLLIGFQLLLAFLNYDINSTPKDTVHQFLQDKINR